MQQIACDFNLLLRDLRIPAPWWGVDNIEPDKPFQSYNRHLIIPERRYYMENIPDAVEDVKNFKHYLCDNNPTVHDVLREGIILPLIIFAEESILLLE